MEDALRAEKLQIERKHFSFFLKENPRGRFLKIIEDVNGRRDTIIVPITGLPEFRKIIDQMIEHAKRSDAPTSAEGAAEKP